MKIIFIIISFISVLNAEISFEKITSKVVKVIDVDTIKISINNKVKTLRLVGVDTPEIDGNKLILDSVKCNINNKELAKIGALSSEYTKENIKVGDNISHIVVDNDKYSRDVVYLLNNHSIKLLLEGFAIAYNSPQLPKYINIIFDFFELYARLNSN